MYDICNKRIVIVVYIFVLNIYRTNTQNVPTSSPYTDFLAIPENNTVLEGTPAVLRCKIRDVVHTCQWFYLEPGLSFYNSSNTPMLVKEFRPANDHDCSIKFNRARRVQNGQWMCKGLQVSRRKYIISEPAFLKVVTREEDMPQNTTENTKTVNLNEGDIFTRHEDSHIVNTELGKFTTLQCRVNRPIRNCYWISPSGRKVTITEASVNGSTYHINQGLGNGDCPLDITKIKMQDEGNWRCVVSVGDERGERLGPIVHLHLTEFGINHTGHSTSISDPPDNNPKLSMIILLIVVAVVFIILMSILVVIIIKRRKKANKTEETSVPQEPPPTISSTVPHHKLDPKFSPPFVPTVGLARNREPSVPNHYTRYLDMTGNPSTSSGSYVMFPAHTPRSPSSATTASLHDRSSISGHTSLTDSQKSMLAYDNSSFHTDPHRRGSLYGTNVYEEIDERYGRPLAEDSEGYMLPSSSRNLKVNIPYRYPQRELPERPQSIPISTCVHQQGYNAPREPPKRVHEHAQVVESSLSTLPAKYYQGSADIPDNITNCTPIIV